MRSLISPNISGIFSPHLPFHVFELCEFEAPPCEVVDGHVTSLILILDPVCAVGAGCGGQRLWAKHHNHIFDPDP